MAAFLFERPVRIKTNSTEVESKNGRFGTTQFEASYGRCHNEETNHGSEKTDDCCTKKY